MILISYDLNGNGKNYPGLFDAIQRLGDCCHCLKSSWLLYTNKTPKQVNDYLRLNCLNNDDHIYVTETNLSTAVGWLPQEVCDWIKAHTLVYR